MFENYSYKQKFHALIVIFFMLSITAYKRSFHTLFEVVSEYHMLSKKADDINKKAKNTGTLKNDVEYLDRIIGKEGVTKEMVQQGIIGFATTNSGASINDLKPIHDYPEADYHIITNQLDVTGNANQLLDLAYNFEKNFNYSRMVSQNFYTTKK
ncbi:hypothetical protein ACQ9BO_08640 [Flavobacterium sp. P21]|uniref:hypothetical protein n=1 Tax=Flavobacterium sp. P21 TaxID=3423948 RepID=UPI003D66C0C0